MKIKSLLSEVGMEGMIDRMSGCVIYMGNPRITLNSIISLRASLPEIVLMHLFIISNGASNNDVNFITKAVDRLTSSTFVVKYINLPHNVGVITARNLGCELMLADGSPYCLIFDNDLLFGKGWFKCSQQYMESLDLLGHDCGIVDFRKGNDWFHWFSKIRMGSGIFESMSIISYFYLIRLEVLRSGVKFDNYWTHRIGFTDQDSFGGTLEDTDFTLQAFHLGFRCGSGWIPIIHVGSQDRILTKCGSRKNELMQQRIQQKFANRWKDINLYYWETGIKGYLNIDFPLFVSWKSKEVI